MRSLPFYEEGRLPVSVLILMVVWAPPHFLLDELCQYSVPEKILLDLEINLLKFTDGFGEVIPYNVEHAHLQMKTPTSGVGRECSRAGGQRGPLGGVGVAIQLEGVVPEGREALAK